MNMMRPRLGICVGVCIWGRAQSRTLNTVISGYFGLSGLLLVLASKALHPVHFERAVVSLVTLLALQHGGIGSIGSLTRYLNLYFLFHF